MEFTTLELFYQSSLGNSGLVDEPQLIALQLHIILKIQKFLSEWESQNSPFRNKSYSWLAEQHQFSAHMKSSWEPKLIQDLELSLLC